MSLLLMETMRWRGEWRCAEVECGELFMTMLDGVSVMHKSLVDNWVILLNVSCIITLCTCVIKFLPATLHLIRSQICSSFKQIFSIILQLYHTCKIHAHNIVIFTPTVPVQSFLYILPLSLQIVAMQSEALSEINTALK